MCLVLLVSGEPFVQSPRLQFAQAFVNLENALVCSASYHVSMIDAFVDVLRVFSENRRYVVCGGALRMHRRGLDDCSDDK